MKDPLYNNKKFLKSFLKIAPLSHAIWRANEALAYQKVKMKNPILDIGCGWGEFAGVVFGKVEMGIDINEKELKMALNGKYYKKVEVVDARKMKYRNSSYATLVSVSVLEHIEKNEKVVAEAKRVLKKNGLFIFSVPTTSLEKNLLITSFLKSIGLNKAAETYFKYHCQVFKHVALHSKKWWENQLKKNGFEIVVEHGTISRTALWLHEAFLVFALPSQLWKVLTGKRLLITTGLRSTILPPIFGRFISLDKDSDINMFFVARKK